MEVVAYALLQIDRKQLEVIPGKGHLLGLADAEEGTDASKLGGEEDQNDVIRKSDSGDNERASKRARGEHSEQSNRTRSSTKPAQVHRCRSLPAVFDRVSLCRCS